MALFAEITWESAAGLRADWESELKAGKLAVDGGFRNEPAPFTDVMLVLIVAGAEVARVPGLVIATGKVTDLETVPESRAFLSAQVTPLVEGGAAGGSTERKRVRLYDDTDESVQPPTAAADEEAGFDNAPTGKHRSPRAAHDEQPIDRKIAALSVGEKVRLAMHGTREERVFLARDRAGVVQASLVRNPRVTIDEVLALARAPHLSADAAEAMAQHPTLGSSAQVVVALVRNPRTPIPIALELIHKLQPHDLRVIAKGLNVRTPIAQAARKKIINSD